MSTRQRQIENALAALRSGEGDIWMPDVTTAQEGPAGLRSFMERDVPGGNYFNISLWNVVYDGDVLPASDTPTWTKSSSGTVGESTDGSTLTLTDDTDAEYVYYTLAVTGLSDAVRTVLEGRLKVTEPDGQDTNTGLQMSIFTGTYQYTAWLRSDGVNIDGLADVSIDMSTWRRVRLVAQSGGVNLYIDGDLRQRGGPANPTTASKISFGTWIEGDYS